MLGYDKHSPGSGSLWGTDRTKFPVMYKVLVGELDEVARKEKRDSRARVLRTPTRVSRVRRSLHTRDREGRPLLAQ